MDAIDGTTNAVRGLPFFCCSLAFATDEKLSFVTDAAITNLSNGDIYWASKGKGAFLNGKSISVHKEKPVYKVIGINTSASSPELIRKFTPIFERHHHVRHLGANALEMAFFAQGLIDVFIDFRKRIRIQDIAAGYLLVKEAGGLLLDENLESLDSDISYETRLSFVAAASKEILDEIFSLIK
jgi:myo-inositol-1(or 4)-monophosphatase